MAKEAPKVRCVRSTPKWVFAAGDVSIEVRFDADGDLVIEELRGGLYVYLSRDMLPSLIEALEAAMKECEVGK